MQRDQNKQPIIRRSNIGLILLAAGAARRFDFFPKQLLRFEGRTLLRRATENALKSSADAVCVVLGANAEKLQKEITDLSVEICINENWADGMASSLQKGVRHLLKKDPQLSAICVTLADQPLVDTIVIDSLIEAFRSENHLIAAAEYAQTVGVPAVFARELFDELLALEASAGAKTVIYKHLAETKKIIVPQAAFDIDTPEDYRKLKGKN